MSKDSQSKRIAGLNRGKIHASDDFDAPLPDEFWLKGEFGQDDDVSREDEETVNG